MDEKPDQILEHIEQQRQRLERNIDELQVRVKDAASWRAQYDRRPYWLLAAAAAGGFLLSALVPHGRDDS